MAAPPASRRVAALSLLLLLAGASRAEAQSWTESGDAGNTWQTVQTPVGVGPLTQIHGTIAHSGDVDAYCIEILDHSQFSASISCAAMMDPSLWLFHFSGAGIAHNDRCLGGMKNIPLGFVGSIGTYFVAVGPQGVQAHSSGGAMWQTGLFTGVRAPDGPGAANNLVSWAGSGPLTAFASYTISLQGASYCGTAVPARPGTWGTIKLLYR